MRFSKSIALCLATLPSLGCWMGSKKDEKIASLQYQVDSLRRSQDDTIRKLQERAITTAAARDTTIQALDSITKVIRQDEREKFVDSIQFLNGKISFAEGQTGVAPELVSSFSNSDESIRRRFLVTLASTFSHPTLNSEILLGSTKKSVGLILMSPAVNNVTLTGRLGEELAKLQETSDSLKKVTVVTGVSASSVKQFEIRRDSLVSAMLAAQVQALPEAQRGAGDIVRTRSQWEKIFGCDQFQDRRIRGRASGRLWVNRTEPVDEPLSGVALLVTYADSVSPPHIATYNALTEAGEFDFTNVPPHMLFDLIVWGERIEGKQAYLAKRMLTDSAFTHCFRPELDGRSTLCAVWQPNRVNACK